jgi:hypothetical protein
MDHTSAWLRLRRLSRSGLVVPGGPERCSPPLLSPQHALPTPQTRERRARRARQSQIPYSISPWALHTTPTTATHHLRTSLDTSTLTCTKRSAGPNNWEHSISPLSIRVGRPGLARALRQARVGTRMGGSRGGIDVPTDLESVESVTSVEGVKGLH